MTDEQWDYRLPGFWLRQAAGDIAMVRVRQKGVLFEHRLFHAQQAVEKALKGVLVARGLPFSRTHDITRLLRELRAGGIEPPEAAEFAEDFTKFADVTRYGGLPVSNPMLSESGCESAAQLAEEVLEWAREEIARAKTGGN